MVRMARQFNERDVSLVLQAAKRWIKDCLIADGSVFTGTSLWTSALLTDDYRAFVEHPDFSADDFMTKLKRQMSAAPPPAQQLMAEALWALLLFPSNLRSSTKRRQVLDLWSMSGQNLPATHPLLSDGVLVGIGSGGTGFNHYRPYELEFLINLTRNLKQRTEPERQHIFCEYDAFLNWIEKVPRNGSRQFRHMLRFFAFPDRVERMSSNNDRRKVLVAFGVGTAHEVGEWDDGRLDQRLMELRQKLEAESPGAILDFYEAPLQERWATERKVKTAEGDVTVSIPGEEEQDEESAQPEQAAAETRPSIHIQAKLARIGAIIGLKVWIPRPDRTQVTALLEPSERLALLDDLPINYNDTTNKTISGSETGRFSGLSRSSIQLRCIQGYCEWPISWRSSPIWISAYTSSPPTNGVRRFSER